MSANHEISNRLKSHRRSIDIFIQNKFIANVQRARRHLCVKVRYALQVEREKSREADNCIFHTADLRALFCFLSLYFCLDLRNVYFSLGRLCAFFALRQLRIR